MVVVWVIYAIWKNFGGNKGTRDRDQLIMMGLQPLYAKLEKDEKPLPFQVEQLANRLELRSMVFRMLETKGYEDTFPQNLNNYVDAGASDLAFYLMHPSELNGVPEAMEHVATVMKEHEGKEGVLPLRYQVYKFPNPQGDWVAGVAGPAVGDEPPYTPMRCTDTFYDPIESLSPEEHVDRVHEKNWPQAAKRYYGLN